MKTTKKIRIESIKDFKGDIIRVFKNQFYIHRYIYNYFGICLNGYSGSNCVFGGDSACEDHENLNYIKEIYKKWDGTLYYDNVYGYSINK